jgi:hypothetical protein
MPDKVYVVRCEKARRAGSTGPLVVISTTIEMPQAALARSWFRAVYECGADVTVTEAGSVADGM